ncbi:translocation/assembly module TamB domain-containing protein [Sphingobacterium suaedae]|uniref:Translocation/assembly module TamB domain-containing protein n=1 Tax=Sphingobacterium suaedae TaxID=1686402 RepID=A0ABW5KDD1_9SPHI
MKTRSLTAHFSLAKILNKKIQIEQITLEEAQFNYHIYKDSTNLTFLINYFSPRKDQQETEPSAITLDLRKIILVNSQFSLTNHKYTKRKPGVDFAQLHLTAISGSFDDIQYSPTETHIDLQKVTFKEQSGLFVRELTATSYISNHKMEFNDLLLWTNRSKVGDYLVFYYDKFADFGDFVDKVNIEGTLNNAVVDSRDIEFFAPSMKDVRFFTTIERASINGTVSHLAVRNVLMSTGSHTQMEGNFRIDGLPIIEHTRFDFAIERLHTSAEDIEQLVPALNHQKAFRLPEQVHAFGQVIYHGKLRGYYHQFEMEGAAETQLGTIHTNSKISIRPILHYSGTASTNNFRLGEFLQSKNLGATGFTLQFDGRGTTKENLHLSAHGSMHHVNFKDYNYRNMEFEGEVKNQLLYANGHVDDPNASFSFDGQVNWTIDTPSYQFSSDIDLLDLKKLNLFTKDSIVLSNSNIHASVHGNSLNSLNGHITSEHLQFRSSRGEFSIGYLDFRSDGDEQSKQLRIQSDVVDGVMSGQIDLNTIGAYFGSLAMRYAPAINIQQKPYNPQNFDLKVQVKAFEPISALFDPHLRLEDGARMEARFSSDDFTANFQAFSPTVSYKGMKLTNLTLTENADDSAFSLDVTADRFSISDSAYVDQIHINNVLANDSLMFQIAMSETNRPNYLNLNGNIHFAYNKPAYIQFDKSEIVLNEEHWTINQDADLRVSKGKFYLNNLLLTRDRQQVSLNGILSNTNDNLDIAFKDFSLASLSGVTKPLGIQLQGHLSGDLRIHSVFRSPNVSAHITTTPIIYNNLPIGNLRVNADFDPQSGLIDLDAKLLDVDGKGVDLAGTYDVRAENDALQLKGKANDIDLGIAYPFLRGLVSNLYGKMSGDITIHGSVQHPVLSGNTQLTEASFIVNYLQTKYTVAQQQAIIQDNRIYLSDFKFADTHQALATANGHIDLNKLSDPTLDVQVTAENFQILNTNRKDNELFFGKAYASGIFRFKGPTTAINMDINARSNPNTAITLPFNTSLKVGDNDFFYFVHLDSSQHEKPTSKRLFKGLAMNMDLALTPDAEINLENNIGSLTSVGTGNISMRISSLGDFEMFGDYHISSGKFHFTAQDFFNKFFELKEGGTIRWAGNPAEAVINLSATYQQRTSIAPLYNAAGRSENNDRILAQADMILKGTLSQPEVSFDLNFPQDPYVKDELQGYLSDGNNINQQAISLIVRRSFTPASTQEFGREVNNTLLSAGTEIAFNQLNSIISQSLNMNFLDLNIRSFNDATASLRFFDDRLILTGGVSDRSRSQVNDLTLFSDQVATDAEVTFRLRQDGNLVIRAYNRLNTRNFLFTPYSDYISAVGLVYRQEFNTLSEFWRKLWIWNERKKRMEPAPKEENQKR